MAEFTAGDVIVPVVPSARDFLKDLKKQVLGDAYKVGQDIGAEMQRGIKDKLSGIYEPVKEQTQRQKQQAPKDGEEIAGAFARGFKARLQAAFQSLPKAEIDADSTAAQIKVQELRTRMAELSGKTVGVDIDSGAALAEVAAIQRELSALDGKGVSADVRIDIASALTELAAIDAAMASIDGRTVRASVEVDVSGALAAIGTVGTALGALAAIPVAASLGAGLLALSGPLAAAGAGFAGVAAVAVPAIGQIKDALKEQSKATDAAAGATKTAAQTAAQAASQAASIASAEQAVTDAKRTAKQAEEDLTRARQDAKRAVEDLRRAVEDQALSEEDAALRVREAQERLNEVLADPEATDLQRDRAELSYRQAVRNLEDQKRKTKDLADQQKAADKAGIEGSPQVVAAKEKIRQANERVEQAEIRLKVAQLQAAAAASQVAKANSAAAKKTTPLTPALKAAAQAYKGFTTAYAKWQNSLAPDLIPAVASGFRILTSLLPRLSPIVKGAAQAMETLAKGAEKALAGPFWTGFFKDIAKQVPTAITGIGKSLGNIATGIAGVIRAFLPFTKDVVGGIESATAKFAAFGQGLGQSEGFQKFIAYARENGPKVIEVVKNIFTVVKNLFAGLAGDGPGVLDLIVKITGYLATLNPETLRTFALAAIGVVAAFQGWKLLTTAVDGVKKSIETASSVINGAKSAWSGLSKAAGFSAKLVKGAAAGIVGAVKGIGKGAAKAGTAVWSGISTAASKAASVAKTSASAIAGAARTAGSAAAKGTSAAWDGIRVAASRAGAAAKTAGTAILVAGKAAATAAVGLGRVAFQYAAIGVQAALSAAKQLIAAAAQRAVAVATTVWAAAQRVLNLVLSANPIGLIITAIGLLVAGLVYAWNNSETFRAIVTAAWEAIKTAVVTAWTGYIQPALQALWQFISGTLAPIFSWLWNTIIVPAWQGISAAVSAAWNNVIKPAVQALWSFLTNTLAPKILWFHQTIVQPVFSKIGQVISVAWNSVIKPALNALWGFIVNTLGPKILWFHTSVVQPVFTKVGEIIKGAWDKVIKPTLDVLVKFITQDVPNGFKTGVDLIGKAWEKVKEVAKAPVKFMIDVVYNGGIVKIWNAVADILGLKTKLQPLAFAKGGIYPGYTPGRDVGFAAVSGGEAIMRPEWTRAVGESYVHKMNAAARSGGVTGVARALGVVGDPGYAGAFAGGGIVGGIKDLLAGGLKVGAEKFLNPLLDQASKAMGDSPWAKLLVGVPKTMVKNVIEWIGKHDTGGDGGKAVAYAKAQIGKPYKWGATGPDSFDCSGLVMRAWQAAGVTDIPRTTYTQIPWVKPVKKPQPGDLGFPHEGHVWMYSSPTSKIVEAPYTGANVREVAARAAMLIGRPPSLFDSGGMLMPGTSLVHNGTGRPEPVLTDRQWQAIASAPTRGGDGALLRIDEFHATPEQSPLGIAKDLRYLMGAQVRLK